MLFKVIQTGGIKQPKISLELKIYSKVSLQINPGLSTPWACKKIQPCHFQDILASQQGVWLSKNKNSTMIQKPHRTKETQITQTSTGPLGQSQEELKFILNTSF